MRALRPIVIGSALAVFGFSFATPGAKDGPTDRVPTIENRHAVPYLDASGQPQNIRSASRAVPVLDNGARPLLGLRALAATSPGIMICEDGTTYDVQQMDDGQRQMVTLGEAGNGDVHFVWNHWDVLPESFDRIDRFVNYNSWSREWRPRLGECGVVGRYQCHVADRDMVAARNWGVCHRQWRVG